MFRLEDYRECFEGGVYGIPDRVKDIDPAFFVVRNKRNNSWEIHHSEQLGHSLALSLPFEDLDERALTYIRQNLRERAKERFAEIERANMLLEARREKERKEFVEQRVKEVYKYAKQHETKDAIPEKEIKHFLK